MPGCTVISSVDLSSDKEPTRPTIRPVIEFKVVMIAAYDIHVNFIVKLVTK
jgi:hypothetical protein